MQALKIALGASLVLAGAPALAGKVDLAPDAACEVVLYGDSVMVGEPKLREGPQRRIQRARPGWTVHMRAVSAQTGHDGALAVLNERRPPNAVVVLGWGINDAIFRTDVAPMRLLVEKIRSEGAAVVITGPVPWMGNLANWFKVQADIRAIARGSEVTMAGWDASPVHTLDGVHPDQQSSNMLVDRLISVLDQECVRSKRRIQRD